MSRKQKKTLQYTIRHIPDNVDRALRRRTRESGKSFNQVALDALTQGAAERREHDDLDFLIGSLSDADARELEAELQLQHSIDPELWK